MHLHAFYRKHLRPVGIKIFQLAVDILLLAWQILRKVALPTRRRKGNVLLSLHDFYVGVVERVAFFERGVLPRSAVFDNRYVRKALLLASCFLFLLSSLEWMPPRLVVKPAEGTPVIAAQTLKRRDQPVYCYRETRGPARLRYTWQPLPATIAGNSLPSSDGVFHSSRQSYFCIFRI